MCHMTSRPWPGATILFLLLSRPPSDNKDSDTRCVRGENLTLSLSFFSQRLESLHILLVENYTSPTLLSRIHYQIQYTFTKKKLFAWQLLLWFEMASSETSANQLAFYHWRSCGKAPGGSQGQRWHWHGGVIGKLRGEPAVSPDWVRLVQGGPHTPPAKTHFIHNQQSIWWTNDLDQPSSFQEAKHFSNRNWTHTERHIFLSNCYQLLYFSVRARHVMMILTTNLAAISPSVCLLRDSSSSHSFLWNNADNPWPGILEACLSVTTVSWVPTPGDATVPCHEIPYNNWSQILK